MSTPLLRAPRHRTRATLAAIIVLLVAISSLVAFGATSAKADVPNPPAAAAFDAPRCEGTTTGDPAAATGPVPNLLSVFGQRLVDYNAGKVVHMYGNAGGNGGVPSCTVRYVEGVGPVSEWTFCTDHTSSQCATTAADGSLVSGGSLEHKTGNPDLTAEQERLISIIVRTNLSVTGWADSTTASNATSPTRTARQLLVWCVSDPTENVVAGFCAANMNATRQAQLLASEPAATMTAVSGSTDVAVGDAARVELTTNVYGTAIPLTVSGGAATITVCGGNATLSGTDLTVTGNNPAAQTTITLCVTSTVPGTVSIAVPAGLNPQDRISWVQSEPKGEVVACQVFATFETTSTAAAPAASVSFREVTQPATGGFTIEKRLAGDAASSVPDGTEFTVEYTVDGGAAETLTVTSGGDPVEVDGLTEGDVVVFDEVNLPTIDGVTWGTPAFTVDGGASSSLTIGADETAAVVLTNTADTTVPQPGSGGFTIQKQVTGDATSAVPAGTEFTVQYTVDGGDAQRITVTLGGDPVEVDGLTEGDVVDFEEVNLPPIDGVTWGTPAFTVDGEARSSLTIGADETAAVVLTNTADTTVTQPGNGGFTLQKLVEGDAASSVPEGTDFTVEYTVDGGAAQTLTVTAGGGPAEVDGLTAGAVVEFDEVDLPTVAGVTWGTPAFTIDGEASSSLTIGADETAAVVLTNTASTTTTPAPTPTPTPSATAPAPSPSGSGNASGSLAVTGGTLAVGLLAPAAVAILGGVILLVLRRRRKDDAESMSMEH